MARVDCSVSCEVRARAGPVRWSETLKAGPLESSGLRLGQTMAHLAPLFRDPSSQIGVCLKAGFLQEHLQHLPLSVATTLEMQLAVRDLGTYSRPADLVPEAHHDSWSLLHCDERLLPKASEILRYDLA